MCGNEPVTRRGSKKAASRSLSVIGSNFNILTDREGWSGDGVETCHRGSRGHLSRFPCVPGAGPISTGLTLNNDRSDERRSRSRPVDTAGSLFLELGCVSKVVMDTEGMFEVEIYGRVRRAVRVKSKSQRAVAREFGLSRDTVRKMLQYAVPPDYRR